MHRLFEKAMLWEMVDWQRNPMELVEIKGISKRRKKPIILTVEQYYLILNLLPEPYRTMVMVAQCTGLRAEEVLALEWAGHRLRKPQHEGDPGRRSRTGEDWSRPSIRKTSCRLTPALRTLLLTWKRSLESERKAQNGISTPLVGLDLALPEHLTGSALSRDAHLSRTTSGRLAAALWLVRSAGSGRGLVRAGRANTERQAASHCMTSAGRLPGSTAALAGIRSATPIVPGWTTPEHRWACSKS